MITAPVTVNVNEVPAVLAVTLGVSTAIVSPTLQVTPNFVPRLESSMTNIWLLAVTAVVLTTMELDTALVGRAALPAADDPHTAGDAELEQFVAVLNVVACPSGVSVGTEWLLAPAANTITEGTEGKAEGRSNHPAVPVALTAPSQPVALVGAALAVEFHGSAS